MRFKQLEEVAAYSSDRVEVSRLGLENYISTENMLTNKAGIVSASKLPTGKTTSAYQKGDTLISNIRPYFKKIWFAENDGGCSNDVLVIRANQGVDSKFLYYVLADDKFFEYDTANSKGTKMPRGDKTAIMRYQIPVLSLDEQRNIAETLSSLDDRIAENKKINHHLEQIATAIWQESFSNIEPNGVLGDIATISSGKRPPVKVAQQTADNQIPILGASSIMGYTNSVQYQEKILVTGRVGTHGVIQRYSKKSWPSDNALVLKSNYYEYTYQVLKSIDFSSMNRGSTQPLVTQTDLKNVPIYIPAANEIATFEVNAGTLMERYEANIYENARLAELRDTLLPRLVSGELSVTD